jgi:outer membrane protein
MPSHSVGFSWSRFTRSLFLLVSVLALTSAAEAQPRIAIIDLQKVFDGYWMTQQADAELKESEAEYLKSRRRLLNDYQTASDEYKRLVDGANDQALAAEERTRQRSEAERKVLEMREIEQSINQFDRTTRQNLEDQSMRMRTRILTRIREVIDVHARKGNFTFVLDTAAQTINRTPFVLYTTGENDLSTAVLAELNAAAPISLPNQPASPARVPFGGDAAPLQFPQDLSQPGGSAPALAPSPAPQRRR